MTSKSPPLGCTYSRVSTKPQEDKVSLTEQEQAGLAYAEENGIHVPEDLRLRETWSRYELWDRPVLDRIRADIRARKFQALICYSVDRLSGDLGHLSIIVAECQRFGVQLHFVTESFDDTPEGKLLRAVKAYTGEVERVRMYERMVIRGKRGRLRSGKLLNGGIDLYGYRRDREKGVRVICEPEAQIVREIFEMTAHQRMSEMAIARKLNSRNVSAPSLGKRTFKDGRVPIWTKTTIQGILGNHAYYGKTIAWRSKTSGTARKRKQEPRPEEEHIVLPEGTTPAIVSEELWRAANDRPRRSWITAHKDLPPALLRGHIFCSRCGRARTPDSHNCGYRCSSSGSVRGSCGGSSIPMKAVEAWVWDHASSIIKNPENMITALGAEMKSGDDFGERFQTEIERANQQIRKISSRQAKLISTFAEEDGVEDLVKSQIRALTEEKRILERYLADLERALADRTDLERQWIALVEMCAGLAKSVDDLSFEEKRDWLKVLDVRVVGEGKNWKMEMGVPITADPDDAGADGSPGGVRQEFRTKYPSIVVESPASKDSNMTDDRKL